MRIATILAAAALSLSAAPASSVDQLGWLAGSWASTSGEEWTEEMWMAPRGGMMLGTNRSGKGASATGFEYMQIAADEKGRISFWASPSGQPAVAFALVSSGPREAVFENPKNDYPTRIVYRREGKVLRAHVSGPGGANKLQWKFIRR
jgi:hypothetical protein